MAFATLYLAAMAIPIGVVLFGAATVESDSHVALRLRA
jgi:hypothetical protein